MIERKIWLDGKFVPWDPGMSCIWLMKRSFPERRRKITSIREVDNRLAGEGLPGPITREIQNIFFRTVKGEEDRTPSWLTTL